MKLVTIGRLAVATGVLLPSGVIARTYFQTAGNSKQLVKITDLPIYGEPEVKVRYVEDEPSAGVKAASVVRENVLWPARTAFFALKERTSDITETAIAHTQSTIDRMSEEQETLARIGVVSLSGVCGASVGFMMGGVFKPVFFSTFAVLTALALCYPTQTVQLVTDTATSVTGIDFSEKESGEKKD